LHQIFTWFDYIVFGVLLISIVFGTIKGLLREVVSLVSLFLSVVLAFRLAAPLSRFVPWWQSDAARYAVAFISIAVLVLIVGMLVGILLKNTAKRLGLGGLDHGLGALFGLVRGAVMSVIMVFLVSNTVMAKSVWYQDSYTKPVFHAAVLWLDDFVPKKLQDVHPKKIKGNQKHHLRRLSNQARHLQKMITKG